MGKLATRAQYVYSIVGEGLRNVTDPDAGKLAARLTKGVVVSACTTVCKIESDRDRHRSGSEPCFPRSADSAEYDNDHIIGRRLIRMWLSGMDTTVILIVGEEEGEAGPSPVAELRRRD